MVSNSLQGGVGGLFPHPAGSCSCPLVAPTRKWGGRGKLHLVHTGCHVGPRYITLPRVVRHLDVLKAVIHQAFCNFAISSYTTRTYGRFAGRSRRGVKALS